MIGEKTAQAMKTAIEMEKSGHRFFTEASNKVQHEVGRVHENQAPTSTWAGQSCLTSISNRPSPSAQPAASGRPA